MTKKKAMTKFCMHNQTVCLAPGLFRSLKRGERSHSKLDVLYESKRGGKKVRFIGFEPLGVDDMRLLQVVVAIAGPEGETVNDTPAAPVARRLRQNLDPTEKSAGQIAIMISTTFGRLTREMGLTDGGRNILAVKGSLLRMSNVTAEFTDGDESITYHLMSHAADLATKKIYIALNPRIAAGILGNGNHIRINLEEVRALHSDPARLIHQRLCGWVNSGEKGIAGVDVLAGYVWPDVAKGATLRQRRRTVRSAMAELVEVGWKCAEIEDEQFSITRP